MVGSKRKSLEVEEKKSGKKTKKVEQDEQPGPPSTSLSNNGEALKSDPASKPVKPKRQKIKAKKAKGMTSKDLLLAGMEVSTPSASNEQEKSKIKRSKRKQKRREEQEAKQENLDKQHLKDCLNYLDTWAHDKSNWKFNKNNQEWLAKHAYDLEKIPDATFEILMQYLASTQGAIRQRITTKAEETIESLFKIEERSEIQVSMLLRAERLAKLGVEELKTRKKQAKQAAKAKSKTRIEEATKPEKRQGRDKFATEKDKGNSSSEEDSDDRE